MKLCGKILCLALALMMCFSLCISAFAAEGDTPGAGGDPTPSAAAEQTGSITLSNAAPGETYKLYKMLDLVSSNPQYIYETINGERVRIDVGQYSYKIEPTWAGFFASDAAKVYFTETLDSDNNPTGYVTWKINPYTGTDVVNFTQIALKYAQDHANDADAATKVVPTATYECPKNDTGDRISYVFDNLDLGYYLLDTSLGSLCTLNTTNPDISVIDKNAIPTNDKLVEEGATWGKENDAAIGDVVKFQSNVAFSSGLDHLTFHDKMDAGLTFINNTAEHPVKVVLDATTSSKAQNGKATELVKGKHYNIVTTELETDTTSDKYGQQVPLKDGCTFHIEFIRTEEPTDGTAKVEDFFDLIETGDHTLTVTYAATLNENANIGSAGNKNTSMLSYGENNNFTKGSTTTTRTWQVPVFKYTAQGGTTKGLSDTKFTISLNRDGTGALPLVKEADKQVQKTDDAGDPMFEADGTTPIYESWAVYRLATAKEVADGVATTTEIVTPESGKFWIQGLDSTTYYLTETEAKAGYNKLDKPVTIVMKNDGTFTKNETSANWIAIRNNAGSILPSTGGIGTTIFYVVGGILAVAAVVLLVTKRRMNAAA